MGQVPKNLTLTRYLIVGGGRLARHFNRYLDLLNIPHEQWMRAHSDEGRLQELAARSTHILVLIRDSEIEQFIDQRPFLMGKIIVHCSGSLSTPLAHGAHPLMSFSDELFDLPTYQKIAFVIEKDDQKDDEGNGLSFAELLPGLPNPHYWIDRQFKHFYHALCVMSGNFSTLLWSKLFKELEDRLDIPREAAFPYFESINRNILSEGGPKLTGPLVRGDSETIERNLAGLRFDPYRRVYEGFVQAYGQGKGSHE